MMNANLLSNILECIELSGVHMFAVFCFSFQSGGYEEDLCRDFFATSGHL